MTHLAECQAAVPSGCETWGRCAAETRCPPRRALELRRRPGCSWRSAAPPGVTVSRLVSSLAARLQHLSLDLCLLCRCFCPHISHAYMVPDPSFARPSSARRATHVAQNGCVYPDSQKLLDPQHELAVLFSSDSGGVAWLAGLTQLRTLHLNVLLCTGMPLRTTHACCRVHGCSLSYAPK